MYGKLAVLNLGDSGRQIGEKLFALLSPGQKKDLVQFVRDYEAGNIPVMRLAIFRLMSHAQHSFEASILSRRRQISR